jgi:hypothetical protein
MQNPPLRSPRTIDVGRPRQFASTDGLDHRRANGRGGWQIESRTTMTAASPTAARFAELLRL